MLTATEFTYDGVYSEKYGEIEGVGLKKKRVERKVFPTFKPFNSLTFFVGPEGFEPPTLWV